MAGERGRFCPQEREEEDEYKHVGGATPDYVPTEDDQQPQDCSVFVTDIARGVTDDMLKEKFKVLGNVLDAFVVKNKFTGDTKGYGFVRFSSMDEVYTALDAKELPRFEDNVSHKVQTVKLTMADPKDTLYVMNIPREWDESTLSKSLIDIGMEQPRKIRFTGSGKTTAYISYNDHEQALRCLKNIQRPKDGAAAPLYTAYLAPPRYFDAKNSPSMKSLFVRGTSGMTQENLRQLFGGTEIVEKVVMPTDSVKGGPIGHAFVHFHSTKAAAEAKEVFNNHEYNGKRLTIEWCLPKAVTHKRSAVGAPPPPPTHAPYPYPYPYPPYPYYPEYDPYYPPPPPYPYPYDPYARGHPGDPREAPQHSHSRGGDRHRSGGSEPYYPFSRGGYPPPHYPPPPHFSRSSYAQSPPPHASHSSHSHSSRPSSHPPQYTHPTPSSDRGGPRSSSYPSSSSSYYPYPPSSSSSASSYPSSRGSRYVPY